MEILLSFTEQIMKITYAVTTVYELRWMINRKFMSTGTRRFFDEVSRITLPVHRILKGTCFLNSTKETTASKTGCM